MDRKVVISQSDSIQADARKYHHETTMKQTYSLTTRAHQGKMCFFFLCVPLVFIAVPKPKPTSSRMINTERENTRDKNERWHAAIRFCSKRSAMLVSGSWKMEMWLFVGAGRICSISFLVRNLTLELSSRLWTVPKAEF